MIYNYFTSTLRNIKKRQLFYFINMTGLAIGFFCVMLIVLFIRKEISYDRFHSKANQIYRVEWHSQEPQTRTPHPMAQALVQDFPEVRAAVSLSPLWASGLTKRKFTVWNEDGTNKFLENNLLSVDTTFFQVFDFKELAGDPQKAIKDPRSIIITRKMAMKYFGKIDCIGNTLTFDQPGNDLKIGAVLENVPDNSHFKFDFLVSYLLLKPYETSQYYTWSDFGHYNYIVLHNNTEVKKVEEKLMRWVEKYVSIDPVELREMNERGERFHLTKLTDIHLHSNVRWELEKNGKIENVYLLITAALFILILAIINFINLSIANAQKRTMEVGVRKCMGATKMQLVLQFVLEAIVLTAISLLVAGVFLEIGAPFLEVYLGIALNSGFWLEPTNIFLFLGIAIITGMIAGVYPALHMSGKSIVTALSAKEAPVKNSSYFRQYNPMLILQFCLSMILISGSLLMVHQLELLQNKPLGFNAKTTLSLSLNHPELRNKYTLFKQQCASIPGVIQLGASSNTMGQSLNQNPVSTLQAPERRVGFSELFVDDSYIETLELTLLQGRSYLGNHAFDSLSSFILNQTGAKALGLTDPVGKEITWHGDLAEVKGKIIAIVEDHHFQSLHHTVKPLLLLRYPAYNHMVLRIEMDKIEAVKKELTALAFAIAPTAQPEITLTQDLLQAQYQKERRLGKLYAAFGLLSILIAGFGLYGMASISFESKSKTIGVKKVFGANVFSLVAGLLKSYTLNVLLAILIGGPVVYVAFQYWSRNFAFQQEVPLLPFVGAALFLLFCSCLTIGLLSYSAATKNPIRTLRQE